MTYFEKAIEYAEKYGIIEFDVKGNEMTYNERHGNKVYCCVVYLDCMMEERGEI